MFLECTCLVPLHHLTPQAAIICCLDGSNGLLTDLAASSLIPFQLLVQQPVIGLNYSSWGLPEDQPPSGCGFQPHVFCTR